MQSPSKFFKMPRLLRRGVSLIRNSYRLLKLYPPANPRHTASDAQDRVISLTGPPKDEFDKIIDDLDKFEKDLTEYNMSDDIDDIDVSVTDVDDDDDS